MTAAVLAVQGAFLEHEKKLDALGIDWFEIRNAQDAEKAFDALILPGGESTVQGRLMKEMGFLDTLRRKIEDGVPTLATCAGMILLAQEIENDSRRYFQTLPVTVRRNAYGRQLGSFFTEGQWKGIGKVPMTFIRAPFVTKADPQVEILAETDHRITAVRYRNQTALSFHPELNEDNRIYEEFFSRSATA